MNYTMNYTKGEWRVDKDKFGDYGIIAQNNLKHSAVADVLRHYDSSEANAHLIAAAPELYEAAKEARDYFRFNKGNASPIFDKLEIALAKAEGGLNGKATNTDL